MDKFSICTIAFVLATGMVLAASGSFGEYASIDACHCLAFNSSSTMQPWVLVNTYNESLQFHVLKPNLTNVVLETSVLNGTIPPNSIFIINVTVMSFSTSNQSGFITAYAAIPSSSNGSSEALQLGTAKRVEVAANASGTNGIPPQLANPAQSQGAQTSAVSSVTQQNEQKGTSNSNEPVGSSAGGSSNGQELGFAAVLPYLGGVAVIGLIAISAFWYYLRKNYNLVKKSGRSKRRK